MVKSTLSLILTVMIIGLVFLTSTCSNKTNSDNSSMDPTWTPPQSEEQALLPSIADVVAKVKPSVVAINVQVVTYDIFNRPTQVEGAGSGWIIDEDGYIVTNNHVVEGADSITVVLNDGRSFSSETVKTDPLTDLAVVKIEASNLSALDVGDSSLLEIGDWLVAIGNALGLGISATSGIVSAQDVTLTISADQTYYNLVQTDTAINPGNSGGPLVNMAGQVIGINSVKIAQVGVEGIGYAISINEAMPIIQQLINTGYVVRPWLGVGLTTVDTMIASFYNLAVDSGALVTQVAPDSPAGQAGLKSGDVITSVDDSEVASASDLVQIINSYDIGQTVEITFWSGQTEETVSVTLGESSP